MFVAEKVLLLLVISRTGHMGFIGELIESIKTTSIGRCKYKSTWIFKKVKPQNDLMYQDIYNCICQNTKKK